MTTLSIVLSDNLAKASQMAASRMGISRTEFIRQAIAHELEKLETELEQEAMAESFEAMKKSKRYLSESESIMSGFSTDLPKDKDEWWKK